MRKKRIRLSSPPTYVCFVDIDIVIDADDNDDADDAAADDDDDENDINDDEDDIDEQQN